VIAALGQRLYDALVLRSRLGELDALISAAKERSYRFLSVTEFHDAVEGARELPARTLILRHDVDWDLRTTRAIFELECRHNISASWYFRLVTADIALMRRMAAAGHDVSYHFEELATLGIRKGAASADELCALIPQAQDEFCRNLAQMRARTGLPMRVVASHGDFLNRRLGVANWVLVDSDIRRRMDIVAEAYDEKLANPVSARFADRGGPSYWRTGNPRRAVERLEPVIYILLHPSNWDSNALAAAWHVTGRLKAEMIYQFRKRRWAPP